MGHIHAMPRPRAFDEVGAWSSAGPPNFCFSLIIFLSARIGDVSSCRASDRFSSFLHSLSWTFRFEHSLDFFRDTCLDFLRPSPMFIDRLRRSLTFRFAHPLDFFRDLQRIICQHVSVFSDLLRSSNAPDSRGLRDLAESFCRQNSHYSLEGVPRSPFSAIVREMSRGVAVNIDDSGETGGRLPANILQRSSGNLLSRSLGRF